MRNNDTSKLSVFMLKAEQGNLRVVILNATENNVLWEGRCMKEYRENCFEKQCSS